MMVGCGVNRVEFLLGARARWLGCGLETRCEPAAQGVGRLPGALVDTTAPTKRGCGIDTDGGEAGAPQNIALLLGTPNS